ncbi:hypothetical protein D3C80_1586120 [compost metagenome]
MYFIWVKSKVTLSGLRKVTVKVTQREGLRQPAGLVLLFIAILVETELIEELVGHHDFMSRRLRFSLIVRLRLYTKVNDLYYTSRITACIHRLLLRTFVTTSFRDVACVERQFNLPLMNFAIRTAEVYGAV